MKFNLSKEAKQKAILLEADKRFHQLMSSDLANDILKIIAIEAERAGQKDKKIKHIDLDNGVVETEDIIISKGNNEKVN